MKRCLAILAMLCMTGAASRAEEIPGGPPLAVSVERTDGQFANQFALQATLFVAASPRQVWKVLTDYSRLPAFIPNLHTSTVLAREPHSSLIEQTGTSKFLFIEKNIRMTVRATEQPFSRIDVVRVSGDMLHYVVQWEIAAAAHHGVTGTRLTYHASIAPDFMVPPLIGSALVAADVRHMLQALAAQIIRQAAD